MIGTTPVAVVAQAIRLDAALNTINQPHNPAVCPQGAPSCQGPLIGAEVRLFRKTGEPTAAESVLPRAIVR